MKKCIIIFIVLLVIINIYGCSKMGQDVVDNNNSNIDEIINTETEATPHYGGEINIPVKNPTTLNPILNKDRTIDTVLKLMFDSLLSLDEQQMPTPNLAKSYTINDQGNIITIVLNDDIKWHDNKPVTSDDVIFTINELKLAPEDSIYKKCVSNIQKTIKISDTELQVFFLQPSSDNLYSLIFPVVPKHYYNKNMKETSDTSLNPIGSGMYRFGDYANMKHIKLIRNDLWYNGRAFFEKINCIITKDDTTNEAAFESNLIDVNNPEIFNWQDFATKEGITVNDYTSYYYDFLGFNFKNAALTDKSVRKAIAYAIDRENINKTIYLNHNIITDFPIHPDSWLAKDYTNIYSLNQDKAKSILIESGWKEKLDEKLFIKDGIALRFKLLLNKQDSTKEQVAELIKHQLEQIGIIIDIIALDPEEYNTEVSLGNFDILLGTWKMAPMPSLMFAFQSANNIISYSDEKMDTFLNSAYNSYRVDSILSSYNNLSKYIQEELPYYSLYFRRSAVITGKSVGGKLKPNTYNTLNGFEELFEK